MIEKVFNFSTKNDTMVEKVIMDENLHFMHMVFNENEGLPQHNANGNLYMTVVRGILSIGLDEQEIHEYAAGSILNIPIKTKMNVKNLHSETLELFVVKSPAPKM